MCSLILRGYGAQLVCVSALQVCVVCHIICHIILCHMSHHLMSASPRSRYVFSYRMCSLIECFFTESVLYTMCSLILRGYGAQLVCVCVFSRCRVYYCLYYYYYTTVFTTHTWNTQTSACFLGVGCGV